MNIQYYEKKEKQMKNRIKLLILLIAASAGLGLTTITTAQTAKTTPVITSQKPAAPGERTYVQAKSLDIVANPEKYLNKYVKINATFDKFSNLGLDYKPAFRSSEKYISFLIKRDDVLNHTIPLSEMKIFMERSEAEKHIDLETGDLIEFSGRVFSTALGDPWIDVEKFTVLTTKSKDKNSTKK
jgi:lysyl-tRNA synthetase class II